MGERFDFQTPVGRFVSGSLTEKRTTDMSNRPIEPERQRYEFGLALRKDDPGTVPFIMSIVEHAKREYAQQPHIVQRIDAWLQTFNGFSMKVSDGDKPNQKGQVNQNTTGHYVVWFSTSLDIQACKFVGQQPVQIPPSEIKRGWFIDVAGNAQANGLVDHNAGVYMNPTWIRLIGEGDEIVGGISAEEAFKGAPPPSLPPGARPVGSTPQPPQGGLPGAGGAGMTGPGGGAGPTQPGGLPGHAAPPTAPAGGGMQTGLPGAGAPGLPGTASPSDGATQTHPPHHGILGQG